MSGIQTSVLGRAWHVWRSLRLPWRKRFFVGQDVQGNTYYELRQPRGDEPASAANRRLVHYPRSTHYSEVRVPPAWHQWLRHQRERPPTMQEQVAELQRQARIKVLAAEADARWEAKPSLLDMPGKKAEEALAAGSKPAQEGHQERPAAVQGEGEQMEQTKAESDPWKQHQRGAPGEAWQPEAWSPMPARKR
ncbi:hypothetical protein F4802DRAFT_88723 [Xylaria palmicola]|nr:hypothetical protein F4802DRAFT_88723 [Xylaria palmicola]